MSYHSGFGLVICKRIIEDNHKGKVWAKSKDGLNAKILMKLPRKH